MKLLLLCFVIGIVMMNILETESADSDPKVEPGKESGGAGKDGKHHKCQKGKKDKKDKKDKKSGWKKMNFRPMNQCQN